MVIKEEEKREKNARANTLHQIEKIIIGTLSENQIRFASYRVENATVVENYHFD